MSARLILGIQPVREAISAHGKNLERVLVEESDSRELDALARFARDRGAVVERVPRADLDRMSRGGRHQGVAAWAPELRLVRLGELELGENALILALDELEDPQNFGAVIRSAVAFGVDAILWPEHHSAPLTPATFRASAGAIEHATLCRVNGLPQALETLTQRGARVVGLDANAPTPLSEVEGSGPTVLVVGAEGKGLRKTVKAKCELLARLPMRGPIDSLNASVAGGIALYELSRKLPKKEPLPHS